AQGTAAAGSATGGAGALPATVVRTVGREQTKGNVYVAGSATTTLAPGTVGATGGGQPHANLQPYVAVGYCIALTGIFPSRG
ncbi:phage tail protein, partial [Acidisphaera rubrifaciens]|uniref:phage tail protein n=1 Tax=Acidisphaera rubrifaciens TaxID=50715 RepID=UPI0006628CCA